MAAARPHWRPRRSVVAVMNSGSRPAYCVAMARNLLVAIVRLEMGLRCVALFTLVAHRSCDGRNSDLAVACVEVGVLPDGVFLLLRCFHTHNPNSNPSVRVPVDPM